MNRAGAVYIVISALGFATLGIFGKLAFAQGWDAQSTLAWRFTAAAGLLWVWLLARGGWRIGVRHALTAFGLGAVGMVVQTTLYFAALERLSAGLTSLLLYTYPVFVALLAWGLERARPSNTAFAAMGLALLGIVLTTDFSGAVSLAGLLIALFTGLWYAAYLVVSARAVRGVPPVPTSAYLFLGTACGFWLILLLRGGLDVPQGLQGWGLIVGVATVATVVPIVALFAGLQRVSATQASILSTLEPLFTVAMGVLLLGERLLPLQWFGGALVLLAVAILQRR